MGRSERSKFFQSIFINPKSEFRYLCIKDLEILSDVYNELKKLISGIDYKKLIFINAAWNGEYSVSGGSLDIQLENIFLSTNYIKLAKNLNCHKFVYLGSVLADFIDN